MSPPSAGPTASATIELNGVQRDGVRHVFAIDQGGNQRLIRRPAKGLGEARNEREGQDLPHLDRVGRYQDRQRRGACHLKILRRQQNPPALDAVRNDAADQGKQKNRNAAEKLVERRARKRSG